MGMKNSRLLNVAVILVLSLVGASVVNAKATHYIIGVEDLEYYPLSRYDKSQGEYKGLAREILDAFAKSKGYIFEYKPYPIKRLFVKLIDNGIDFKFPDNPYWANDLKGNTKITYSGPTLGYVDGVFVTPENIGKGDDSIKVLGSVLGFTPWNWLERINKGEVKLKETPNFEALIHQAISGRIDGAYVNTDVVGYQLKVSGKDGALVFDKELPHTKGDYMLSTVQHPHVVTEFNIWLSENKELIIKLRNDFGMK